MDGYIVRFVRKDQRPAEEYYYSGLSDAAYHLNLFRDDDSGLYQRIDLLSADSQKVIDQILF